MTRKIPHDLFCEQQVISCALIDGIETIAKAQEAGVQEGAFHHLPNRIIWNVMLELVADGKDPFTEHVALELTTKGTLDAVGGFPYLTEVSDKASTTANRNLFIARLVELHRLRELIKESTSVTENCYTYSGDGVEATFSPKITKMAAILSGGEEGIKSLSEFAESAALAVESPETAVTIPSGWADWDRVATPLKAGEMITLAARPGQGKSALSLQIANKLVYKHHKVLFFSLEMQGEEVVHRMALQRGGREAMFDPKELAKGIREVGQCDSFHLFDNRKQYSMTSIESRSRLHAAKDGIALIILDYLQLITPSDRRIPREQQVAEISRRCKQLAGEVQAPIMVLAQLNREVEKQERRPILSDLRESGAIEQDSDRVWFIHQDQKDGDDDYQLIQAKCRGGPGGVGMKFKFDKPTFRFSTVTNA